MLMVRLLTVLVSFVLLFCFFYLGGAMLVGFGVGFETAMEQEKAGEYGLLLGLSCTRAPARRTLR